MDCANGVGGLKLQQMQQRLASAGLQMRLHATGDGELNGECGADFVQKERDVPAGFPREALTQAVARSVCMGMHQVLNSCSQQAASCCGCGLFQPCVCLQACALQGQKSHAVEGGPLAAFCRCASIDGDADRLVYFSQSDSGLRLFDGDRIAVLAALLIHDLAQDLPQGFPRPKVSCISC